VSKSEDYSEPLLADGFESAFIGWFTRCGKMPIACYDYDKCVVLLMKRDKMSETEAIEYMDFNVVGAWVGEGTPAFLVHGSMEEFREMLE